jgi:tetratricopeptide (TPR) repeat protein
VTDSLQASWSSSANASLADVSLDEVVDAASRVLTELGPMTEEQLVAALADRGADLDDADFSMDDVLDAGDGQFVTLTDDRWASLPALLAGRVFTHRVTGPELEHDILTVTPDFGPVMGLVYGEDRRLIGDAPVECVFAEFDADTLTDRGIPLDVIDYEGALLLPPGYLRERGCREGDVIALGVGPNGLSCEVVAQPAGSVAVLEQRLKAVLANWRNPPVELDMAVWAACADDPTLFTEPLPPLAEAVDACGLSRDGDWLAPRGFDFLQWRIGRRCVAIARRYDLDYDDALAVASLKALYLRALSDDASGDGRGGGDATFGAVAPFLVEPAVAEAVLAETIGLGRDGAEALASLAETIEPLAPRNARPGLLWLRGKAYERIGDIARAEADYEAARGIDPDWALALIALARYANYRGDADRGLTLLRRAGAPADDPMVQMLGTFQGRARPGIGRNDPCWCGSGRKYKKCHLHNERAPLEVRSLWLYFKAVMFVTDGPWYAVLTEAAQLRGQYEDGLDASVDAMGDPLISDAVLFEGGAFAEFVATRGALLPDDERLLAEQWLLIDRSVYDVEEVRPGVGFTLRDVRTGDSYQVQDRTASRMLRRGEFVCTRVVPAGDTMRIFGGVEPVALHERDELIALLDSRPDHLELVSFLTRRWAPAAIRNEGDPALAAGAPASAGGGVQQPGDETDPEMAAALDQFIRDYERRWLDDRIPALAGYTPRQAAADPTRRGDLIRLIDSFPVGLPGTMNPDRLRAELGLR